MKVAIMGYSGSGKSTLAKALGEKLRLPVLHLDQVHWLPGWVERDQTSGNEQVRRFMEQPDWVIDGNYSRYQFEERLNQADKIIFLDFNRWSCLLRALKRRIKYHGLSRDDMGESCQEKVDIEFIWWILYTSRSRSHRKRRAQWQQKHQDKLIVISSQPQLSHFMDNAQGVFPKKQ